MSFSPIFVFSSYEMESLCQIRCLELKCEFDSYLCLTCWLLQENVLVSVNNSVVKRLISSLSHCCRISTSSHLKDKTALKLRRGGELRIRLLILKSEWFQETLSYMYYWVNWLIDCCQTGRCLIFHKVVTIMTWLLRSLKGSVAERLIVSSTRVFLQAYCYVLRWNNLSYLTSVEIWRHHGQKRRIVAPSWFIVITLTRCFCCIFCKYLFKYINKRALWQSTQIRGIHVKKLNSLKRLVRTTLAVA